MKIYNRCSLCFKGGTEEFYNKMINIDSLQLCPECYKEYNKNEYYAKAMLCNSIKMYRKKIENEFVSKDKIQEIINDFKENEDFYRERGLSIEIETRINLLESLMED